MGRKLRIGIELCVLIGLFNVLVYAEYAHYWCSMLVAGWCFGMAWSLFDDNRIEKFEEFREFKRRNWVMVNIFKKG
jgi:hypothetical protein